MPLEEPSVSPQHGIKSQATATLPTQVHTLSMPLMLSRPSRFFFLSRKNHLIRSSPPHHTRSSRLRRLQKNNLHLPAPTSPPARLLHLSHRPRWSPRRPLQKWAECHPQARKQCLHLHCFYPKTCCAWQSPHSF